MIYVIKVRFSDNTRPRIANENDKQKIGNWEKYALEKFKHLGIKDLGQMRASKYWTQYKKLVQKKLQEETNIDIYYRAYDITVMKDYIDDELNDLADLLLDDIREEKKNHLNALICANFLQNAQNRHKEAARSKKMGMWRIRSDYEEKIKKLINWLIDTSDDYNLSKEVNKVKLIKDPFTEMNREEEIENEVYGDIGYVK